LLMHIRSMKDWGNYEVELPNEYDSSINYERLEQLVNQYAYILEDFLSYELSANMKKSIVIHICVAIIRNRRYLPKISVVIVCPGSMATGKYLEAQIRNYFDFHIIGVLAARQVLAQLEQTDEQVDFIISTVSIYTDQYEVIKVHPFLKMEDLNLIQKLTFRRQTLRPGSIQHKKEILLRNVKEVFEDQELIETLSQKIEEVICRFQDKTEKRAQSIWQGLFDAKMIEIEENDIAWKDAMHRSARILENGGFITSDYIEEAISNVEEYGDYIMVSKGVALAHASKDSGVFKDGVSLLLSRKGIWMTEGNDKVYLMFCFATTGEKEYYELIKNIVMIGRTDGMVEKIKNLDTAKEIYQTITAFSWQKQ
jgi:mannitol operon transcriptional antiterminator